jgi:hypothetical protein
VQSALLLLRAVSCLLVSRSTRFGVPTNQFRVLSKELEQEQKLSET